MCVYVAFRDLATVNLLFTWNKHFESLNKIIYIVTSMKDCMCIGMLIMRDPM